MNDRARRRWELEHEGRQRILAAPKGSAARRAATREAYERVAAFYAEGNAGQPFAMGYRARYARLVIGLLTQQAKTVPPRYFEIGYGCGQLLGQVAAAGFPVAGIEVSPALRAEACRAVAPEQHARLLTGDFLTQDFVASQGAYSLVYWNDVFEHIPPDEILDYLRRIHALLAPGGQLVTITPNWHMRPKDGTKLVFPPRTEASGLHLREYTLRDVSRLLGEAGFGDVRTPLVVTPPRVFLAGRGLVAGKQRCEPALERLPFWMAKACCLWLGLGVTIARKPAA